MDISVRQFKLYSGEDVIALVNKVDGENYIVERPFKLIQNLVGQYQLTPWFQFSDQTLFKILRSRIIHSAEISAEIREAYISIASQKRTLETPVGDSDSEGLEEYVKMLRDIDPTNDMEEPSVDDDTKERTIH